MFELRGVIKRYGGAEVIPRLDLEIPTAKTTVLLGPSGCGKSTVLRLLNGLITPEDGEVRFRGARVGAEPDYRHRMGYVVQGGGLFPHLSARQNAALLARHLGWAGERIAARVAELAELVRLPPALLDRFPAELSGGQAQRVSLMRALMLDPDVLLLDEPLGALDPITRFDLQGDLHAIFARLCKTVVLVTHDLGEAAFFAHHVVLMKSGRIVQRGQVHDLVRSPADPFVTQFVAAQRPAPLP